MEPLAQAFLLFFYLWNPYPQSSNPVTAAEFTTLERCKQAGERAKTEFGGAYSKPFYFCVPK